MTMSTSASTSQRLKREAYEQRSRTFQRVVWTTMAIATLILMLQILEDPATLARRAVSIAFTDGFGLIALALNKRGYTRFASGLFIAALLFIVTWRAWSIGGLDAPLTAAYVVMVVMGGVLLGWQGGATVAVACAALTLTLITAKVHGWLPPAQFRFSPVGLWLSNCIWIALAFGLQGQIAASLREALRRTERELHQRRDTEHQLRERVKELRLLHAAATLLQQSHATALDLFNELVPLIPAAWQYPEVCAARITFGDAVAATPNWRATEWCQAKTFTTEEGTGTIEVVYLEPRPPADDGPFLTEERAVLDSLAEMLVAYVQLRRQRQGLEELVTTRTRELSIARDEADRASRAKSTFLANMSHEIRTPLNAVLGHAQLLSREPSLSDAQRRSVSAISSSGTHLLTVINEVLEMSKIEAGRTQLAPQPMDLYATLADVEHMFTALSRAKNIDLQFERDAALPRALRADAPKIRQVLINLLGNAVKFTERGSVRLHASARTLTDQTAGITLDVTDTGPGIAEHDQPRIFAAFEQSTSGLQAGGTGLGLTISQSFARLMQGDVTLRSHPGAGSTFSFTFVADLISPEGLPVVDPQTDLATHYREPASPPRAAPSPALPLAQLITALPAPLRAQLREAAIQARTTRLAQLADQVAELSPEAARAIAQLVDNFRYDDLVTAIDGLGFDPRR